MAHVPLVELVVARHQHGGGATGSAACASDLLAHRRQCSREPVADHGVERADVDTELERVGGDHAAELAGRELGLELTAFVGEVPGAVRRHVGRAARGHRNAEHRPGVGGDQLGAAAAAGEGQRLMALLHEAGEQHRRLQVGRGPGTAVRVEERSLPHRERALGPWCGVVAHRVDREATELRRELGRVADRRAGEAEHRVGPVVRAQASQPSQHVRDVAAEEPAQHVELVDHDVAQAHEEGRPLCVRREDPDVQHLGVREQHGRVGACPRALVGRGVAVVGRRHERGEQPLSQ